MGMREKKRSQRRVLARRTAAPRSGQGKDFLPLEGGPGTRLRKEEPENNATVVYIGHIPHGFYEDQMQGFFQQFGTVKRLRIARNRKTGKSKHYGFVEFENPEVGESWPKRCTTTSCLSTLCKFHLFHRRKFIQNYGRGYEEDLYQLIE